MKRVINGRLYDTETTELVAAAEGGGYRSNFSYWEERLYRTRAGEYFIAGSGNASSRYSQPVGNNCRGAGEGLRVITEADALAWCEQNEIDPDVIAELFAVEAG